MSPDDPRHGTGRQNLRDTVPGCTCDNCERNRRHIRRTRKLRQIGRGPMVDAAPIAAHIERLVAAGWNQQGIARAAGVGVATVSDIRRGVSTQARRPVAHAIASLNPASSANAPWTSSVGTVRRLQALQALGWPMGTVCLRAGLTRRYGAQLIYTHQEWVAVDAAQRVARVYEELSMTLPPSTREANHARAIARRNGGIPPLAWDDDRIDDPDYTPTGWQYRPADRADILADLLERGAGISEALRVLGVSYDALEKWCERHDRGIWRRLLDNENPHRGGNQHREAS